MSGRSIGQIAGTIIGFYFGGPVGASIGATIGGQVGSTFDPTQELYGPRLSDLQLQASSYGVPLPLVYGPDNRVSGVVIWSTGLIERRKRKKSGGKGGGGGSAVTTYSYRTSVAVALSEGECNNIRRVWANKKLLFDISDVQAEVARLHAKSVELDAAADEAEAAAAADPGRVDLQLAAEEARADADAAAAAYATAQLNYSAALEGGAPWRLDQGAGMPPGALRSLAFYPGSTTQEPDPTIEAATGAGNTSAYRGVCYVVLGDLQLADYGNSLPNLEFELDGLAPRTVAGILRDICDRSGLQAGEYAVRQQLEAEEVRGYAVASLGNSMAAIAPLQSVFFFDTAEQGGEVRFLGRGSAPVCVIPVEDIAAREPQDGSTPERFLIDRTPDFELAREVSVTYRDPERDYQDNTQRSTRLFGEAYTVKSVQAPVTLSSAQARQVADRLLWEEWANRLPAAISVTDKYRFLGAGDVLAFEVSGTWVPMRVENQTRGANGVIDLELRMEDPFVYAGSTAGEEAAVPANSSAAIGETFVAALNTPILATGQTATSFAWVMDAAGESWPGGAIYRSTDGGENYSEMAASGERNVTGTVSSPLAAGPTDLWDRVNTLTVALRYEDHELESLEEAQVLAGKNSVWLGAADGSRGEVLQFATATLTSASPRTYVLSDLLRGRRATEHEVGEHGADELFVFLEADLMRSADYDVADWDRARRYKGVTGYEALEDVLTYQEFTNLGERARPRSPVHGAGERDGSNNLSITWFRRVRGFQPGLGYGVLALDEATEAYEVDVLDGATVVRTISASTTAATYTAAEQTADGLTPGDPVTVRIYQLSASRGRGHYGEFTV